MVKEKPSVKIRLRVKDDYFNYNLRNARLNAGYTLKRLSKLANTSMMSIESYERLRVMPPPQKAEKIARVLKRKLKINMPIVEYKNQLFPESLREIIREINIERGERRKHYQDALDNVHYLTKREQDKIVSGYSSSESEVEQNLDSELLRERITEVLKTLTYREREIVKLKYGINGDYSYTPEEIAYIFKVSVERIRRIEIKAMAELRMPERASQLEEFLG